MAKDKARLIPRFEPAHFDRSAHKNLLQIPLVIDTGRNGNSPAGLLQISGDPLARRTGQSCCHGGRPAAAAVFPVQGVGLADVDGWHHLLGLGIAEDEAVSWKIFAVDIVF